MKIGILTYHRAHNYGALLQAYALLTYLRELGQQAEIIDYWPNYHAEDYKLIPYFKTKNFKGKIKSIFFLIIGYSRILKRSERYKQFIREQFGLSDIPRYLTEDDMKDIEYDLVVYGSDQIWRRSNYSLFKGFSDVYFGACPKKVKRKIAYAASMGIIEIEEKDKPYLRRMVHNFDAISVRENELKQLINKYFEHPVVLVLDPVLLLSKEKWLQFIHSKTPIIQNKYIFLYQLIPSSDAIILTNRLKAYYGYKVIEIRGRVEPQLLGDRYLQTASPSDFLSLIKNAEIIVSTSFHGIAFSLIFEKQFYALGMGTNSGRAKTLLDQIDLPNRYLSDIKCVDFKNNIDYNKVNIKIASLRQQSEKYLINNLSKSKYN